ncbi:MAG TPA: response regulator [Burkholderiaceae bacterium]
MLVVEPDELIRQLLCAWLTEAGYAVEAQAPSGQIRRAKPDLVILNVPRAKGFQAAVDSLSERYSGPILAISAQFRRGLGASAAVARRLGVRRVLPKPFTREELLQAVTDSLDMGDAPR